MNGNWFAAVVHREGRLKKTETTKELVNGFVTRDFLLSQLGIG